MKHLLQEAAHEIKALRRRNEVLEAQVDVVNTFRTALHAERPQRPGMSKDIAWELERAVAVMESELIGASSPDRAPASDLAKVDVGSVVDPKRLREAIRRARSSSPIKQPRKGAKK